MEREEIVRLAHEAECLDDQHYGSLWADRLIRFADLVADAERERCAKVCDFHTVDDVLSGVGISKSCADMIRALP